MTWYRQMVYTFSDRQERKLKGYFNRMRKEGKQGYDVPTLNKATDHRLFCEYFEGVARGYIRDEDFFDKFHPTKLPWFYDELLNVGPQRMSRTKVIGFIQGIKQGAEHEAIAAPPAREEKPTNTISHTPQKTKANRENITLPKRPRKKPKQLVSLKIDPDLYEQAKVQAEREERTFAALVRFLLAEHIQKNTGNS